VTAIRVTARPRGIHVDVAIRAGEDARCTLGLCGNLCMRAAEWRLFKYALETGAAALSPKDQIVFVEPRDEEGAL